MKSQLTVVGLGGSLAEHSSSLAALKIALQGAADAGAKTDLLNIRQLSLPMYDPGTEVRQSRSWFWQFLVQIAVRPPSTASFAP